eukprot:XP_017455385.1 PREDICTED: PHD finger protein 11-like [Rattus norvegicus]
MSREMSFLDHLLFELHSNGDMYAHPSTGKGQSDHMMRIAVHFLLTMHPLFVDAAVKASFLKKCLEAGLLTELFEQILQKMISIHGRFMDETASESDYEGIKTLLFDCGLFGDILRKFQEVIKSKTCEYEERLNQMKQKLEALADLQENLCSFQECGDLDPSGSTSGSLLPPEDHQCRCQESPEVQAGSGDSL